MQTRGAILVALSLATSAAWGRTITLTAEDCDQMAVLSPVAPDLSWAAHAYGDSILDSGNTLQMKGAMTLLMRFPLTAIPADQRIIKAELTCVPSYIAGKSSPIQVRRVLADWGPGVCHKYRRTYPTKEPWNQPGGRGSATDRASKDTGVFPMKMVGDPQTVDVTEDIEIWYTGSAPNHGWILNLMDDTGAVYLPAPYYPPSQSGKSWKLVITYEPK